VIGHSCGATAGPAGPKKYFGPQSRANRAREFDQAVIDTFLWHLLASKDLLLTLKS
jgi:hypothetical protein